MSTPIETNTEQLQEVLQQVYNLPSRSGGNAGYDLIIDQNSASIAINTPTSADNFVITKGSLLDVWQRVQNGEKVKACVRCGYHYGLNTYRKVYDIDRIITEGLTATEHDQYPSGSYHGNLAKQAESLTCMVAVEDCSILFQASTLESINNNVFDVVNVDLYPDYDFVLGFTTEYDTSFYMKPELTSDMVTIKKGTVRDVINAIRNKKVVKVGVVSECYYWTSLMYAFSDVKDISTNSWTGSDRLILYVGIEGYTVGFIFHDNGSLDSAWIS